MCDELHQEDSCAGRCVGSDEGGLPLVFLEPDEEDSSVCAFRPVRPFTYPSYEIIPTQEITA